MPKFLNFYILLISFFCQRSIAQENEGIAHSNVSSLTRSYLLSEHYHKCYGSKGLKDLKDSLPIEVKSSIYEDMNMYIDIVNQVNFLTPLVSKSVTNKPLRPEDQQALLSLLENYVTFAKQKTHDVSYWYQLLHASACASHGPHSERIKDLACMSDGSIVLGYLDGMIYILDAKNGQIKKRLLGHSGTLTCVSVMPNNNKIVSGSGDKIVRVWDYHTGQNTMELKGHTERVSSAEPLTSDVLASSGSDHTIRLWNLNSGDQKGVLIGHDDQVLSLACMDNGNSIVSGSVNKQIRLWDVQTMQTKAQLNGHDKVVESIKILSNGRIVSGGHDQICVWDDRAQNPLIKKIKIHANSVGKMAVLAEDNVAFGWTKLEILNLNNDAQMLCPIGYLHKGRHKMSVSTLPDGSLAAGFDNGCVSIWDLEFVSKMNNVKEFDDFIPLLDHQPSFYSTVN